MLVLSRKVGEKIQIGENIFLTVIKVTGKTIKLGIDAPKDVRVLRDELPKHSTKVHCLDHVA